MAGFLLGVVFALGFASPSTPRHLAPARPSHLARGARIACADALDEARRIGAHVGLDELSNERLLSIVQLETTDVETNELVWRCLGYRRDVEGGAWDSSGAFAKFREKFPQPPDLIGITRTYSKEVDEPVLRANQALHRSIPMAYKQGLKTQLRPLGFTGFKLANLTPNMTRRAQVTNWILYYREGLYGKTFGDVRREKEEMRRLEDEEAAKGTQVAPTGQTGQYVV
ncbi:hypothetical protein T492DRAFT_964259 [Pavlovales sp. CCMP2436]|nr:hypothetical protein T492DRAFT_964259 [Pavlovales sp. CCMP2436]